MQYDTNIEKSDDGLFMVLEKAQKFNSDNILTAIIECRKTPQEVLLILEEMKEYHARLNIEYRKLTPFFNKYNEQYATDDKERVDLAYKLFYKIRSSISQTKRIYKQFCKTDRKNYFAPNGTVYRPSAFDKSFLSAGAIRRDLFGVETFPECVRRLCEEMESFFIDLIKAICLCRNMLNEERDTKSNYKRCLQLYERGGSEVCESARAILNATSGNSPVIPNDPLQEERRKGKTLQEFITQGYHAYGTSSFRIHAISRHLEKGRSNGLTKAEVAIWGIERKEWVEQTRWLISNFDRLNPCGQKDKLNALYVYFFMQNRKTNPNVSEQAFLAYFNEQYTKSGGRYKTVSSINAAKNNCLRKRTKSQLTQEAFDRMVDELLEQYGNAGCMKAANF